MLDKILCSYFRRFSGSFRFLFFERSSNLRLGRSEYLSLRDFPKNSLDSLRIQNGTFMSLLEE